MLHAPVSPSLLSKNNIGLRPACNNLSDSFQQATSELLKSNMQAAVKALTEIKADIQAGIPSEKDSNLEKEFKKFLIALNTGNQALTSLYKVIPSNNSIARTLSDLLVLMCKHIRELLRSLNNPVFQLNSSAKISYEHLVQTIESLESLTETIT